MALWNFICGIFRSSTPRISSIESTPILPKKQKIPPKIRDQVWTRYHKRKNIGPCYACGTRVYRLIEFDPNRSQSWHCSHVQAENKGGEISIDNLRTCCQQCNLSMGNQNLYAYIRDRRLKGPGARNIQLYFQSHPELYSDRRTNNWGKAAKAAKARAPIITPITPIQPVANTPSVFNRILSLITGR